MKLLGAACAQRLPGSIGMSILAVLLICIANPASVLAQQEPTPADLTGTDALETSTSSATSIGQVYIVRPGDSLTRIARNVFEGRISANDILNATNAKAAVDPAFSWVTDRNIIVVGQLLWVPTTGAVDAASASSATDAGNRSEPATTQTASATFIPRLRVENQAPGAGNTFRIHEVTLDQPGSLYIIRTDISAPNSIVGQAAVPAGTSQELPVTLNETVPFGTELFVSLSGYTASNNDAELTSQTALLPPFSIANTSFRVGLNTGAFSGQDSLAVLASLEKFSILLSAIETAQLTDILQSSTPLTLYLPTNEAFSQLSEEQLELLLSDSRALEDVLRHHMVAGRIVSANLRGTRDMPTLGGGVLTLRIEEEQLSIGNANVLFADILTRNGMLYAIDQVLLPPFFNERLAAQSSPPQADSE